MNRYLLSILLFIGLIWGRSSYGKFSSGSFVDGLGATLGRFASNNPYPLFKSFLQDIAGPNSQLFGQMVLWGELLVAVSLISGTLYLLLKPKYKCGIVCLGIIAGLIGGALMNLFFWLASGYMSPSTDGLNLLMLVIQIAGISYLIRFHKA